MHNRFEMDDVHFTKNSKYGFDFNDKLLVLIVYMYVCA